MRQQALILYPLLYMFCAKMARGKFIAVGRSYRLQELQNRTRETMSQRMRFTVLKHLCVYHSADVLALSHADDVFQIVHV